MNHKISTEDRADLARMAAQLHAASGPRLCIATLVNFALVLDAIRAGNYEMPPAEVGPAAILGSVMRLSVDALMAAHSGRAPMGELAALAAELSEQGAKAANGVPPPPPDLGASAKADALAAEVLARAATRH